MEISLNHMGVLNIFLQLNFPCFSVAWVHGDSVLGSDNTP